MQCFDSMLYFKYADNTFYVHYLAKDNIVFLLKTLIQAKNSHTNLEGNPNTSVNKGKLYKLDIICRDNTILSLSISKTVKKRHIYY